MTEPAHDYQTIATATTEGLDSLFEIQDSDVQDTVQDDLGRVQDVSELLQDTVQEEINVLEASRLLQVDRRSVVRLLNWQKLSGRKDKRGNWLVNKQSVLERLRLQDTVHDPVQVEVQDTVQEESADVLDVSDHKQNTVQEAALDVIKQQSEQLKQAYTYLDAATARILYLQEQLEQKDREIKLLTDSQHKPVWWRRTWSWFIGRQN